MFNLNLLHLNEVVLLAAELYKSMWGVEVRTAHCEIWVENCLEVVHLTVYNIKYSLKKTLF